LVGRKTSYQTEINAFISKNKLQSRVHFIHNILFQELPVLYQAATIFCYPSFSEGFGIPVLEALCSGVPVIAAAGGCLEEAGGPDSVYIDPKNAKELEYKIAEVQKNSEIREKMIRRGYDHSAKFSDQIIAEQWNTLYQQMISKG
jgi:glycosyltransferase involved in cell wall biosynthesis